MIRLRYERIQRGLSQAALAYMTKVPQPVICLIETGKWNASSDELDALARVLGIAPAAVLLKPIKVHDPEEVEPLHG